jgi:hypothetical protein
MKLDKKIINNAIKIQYSFLLKKNPNLEELFVNNDSKILADLEADFLRFEHLGITYEEYLEIFKNFFEKIEKDGTALDEGYVPWLDEIKDKINWKYWNNYKASLESKGWSKSIVTSLDNESDKILDRTFNPLREHIVINRRGLVIGKVQSGKTANYMGVVSKALDAGFKIIIILTGIHESLRRQTYSRIQEDIGQEGIHYHTSDETDFRSMQARIANDIETSNDKHLFIIKKNSSVLKNLIYFLRSNRKKEKYESRAIIIDDEADNASINTKNDEDPTTTNKSIRELLNCFLAKAYIGYTATPYANVFIDKDIRHKTLEDDIFPKDFIITLPISQDYCGASKFFPKDFENNPLFNIIRDETTIVLFDAIKKFVLSTSIRRSRGIINQHNTMLVHDSFKIADHASLRDAIQAMIVNLTGMLFNPNDSLINSLKNMYYEDFIHVSKLYGKQDDWNKIQSEIKKVINDIEVVMVNSIGQELDYPDDDVKTYIAVGGNKLSRGLTLEGLTISVFSRSSSQYDTLMQMGRWFGYRLPYLDLCRIIVPLEVYEKFDLINLANQELYEDLETLNSIEGMTPKDFALKVRAAYNMLPTSKSKMGKSISFAGLSGKTKETLRFGNKDNIFVTEEFIDKVGGLNSFRQSTSGDCYVKENVQSSIVVDLIDKYIFHPNESNFDKDLILSYLDEFHKNEDFNVVVVNQKGETKEVEIAGMIFKPVIRTVSSPWRLKRLLAPSIELMDLDYIYKNDIVYQNDRDVLNDSNLDTISFKNFKIKYRKKLTLYIIFVMLKEEKEKKSRLVTGLGISFKSINEKISNYYYNL